ncbi:MAG: hypothetical protein AABY64_03060 [Bdellovibrionota bacterium]
MSSNWQTILPIRFLMIIATALSLVPIFSHAGVFWDDEMESTISGQFYYEDFFPSVYTHDTTVKISGKASTRVNFPSNCDVTQAEFKSGKQCGGSVSRSFPNTKEVYKRVYFMMSGSTTPLTNPTANCLSDSPRDAQNRCLFRASHMSSTKVIKGQSLVLPFDENNIRHWWNIGSGNGTKGSGGTNLRLSAEHVPTYFSTTDQPLSSISLQSNKWYCIETQEKVNSLENGVAQDDGIGRAWVDGVQVLNRTDIIWRRSPKSTSPNSVASEYLWNEFSLMRQNGAGYFWFDRFAAGDTRIGCIGSGADPTPVLPTPLPPKNLKLKK